MKTRDKLRAFALVLLVFLVLAFSSLQNVWFLPSIQIAHASPSNEDFTGYTEHDDGADNIQIQNATHMTWDASRDQDDWVNKTFSTGYFTDFNHTLEIRANTSSSSAVANIWCLANVTGTYQDLTGANEKFLFIMLYDFDGGNKIRLYENNGTANENSEWNGASSETWYYLTIVRSGSDFYCEIRNATHLEANLTLTLDFNYNFKVIMPIFGYNTDSAKNFPINIRHLDFQIAPQNSVTLNSPVDTTTEITWTVSFSYTPVFYQPIVNACLWTNETSWSCKHWNSTAVQNNTQNTISETFSSEGTYLWNVKVFNTTYGIFATTNFTITIDTPPRYQNIGSNTTTPNIGDPVLIYGQGYDGWGLDWAFLSMNDTGSWLNYTVTQTTLSNTSGASNWVYPQGLYYNQKTYFVWLNSNFETKIQAYNHTSKTWGQNYTIDTGTGEVDWHYVPAIARDSSGYLYVFYGSHNDAQLWRKSTNPQDESAWGSEQSISGVYTYPSVFLRPADDKIYFFSRDRQDGASRSNQRIMRTWNGTDWSSETVVVQMGLSDSCYGTNRLIDNNIYLGWAKYDGTNFRDIYYSYSDDAGSTWKHANGTALSLPLSDNAKILTTSTETGFRDIALDDSSYPVIAFKETDAIGDYLRLGRWNGTDWNFGNVTVGGSNVYSRHDCTLLLKDEYLRIYVPQNTSGNFAITRLKETGSFTFTQEWVDSETFSVLSLAKPVHNATNAHCLGFLGTTQGSLKVKAFFVDFDHDSPIDMNDIADSWSWSNFTWTNSSAIVGGTVVGWKLYYQDTYGNINGTSIRTFTVGEVQAYSVSLSHSINIDYSQEEDWATQLDLTFNPNIDYSKSTQWQITVPLNLNPNIDYSETEQWQSTLVIHYSPNIDYSKQTMWDTDLSLNFNPNVDYTKETQWTSTIPLNLNPNIDYSQSENWQSTIVIDYSPNIDYSLDTSWETTVTTNFQPSVSWTLDVDATRIVRVVLNWASNIGWTTDSTWNSKIVIDYSPNINYVLDKDWSTSVTLNLNPNIGYSLDVDIPSVTGPVLVIGGQWWKLHPPVEYVPIRPGIKVGLLSGYNPAVGFREIVFRKAPTRLWFSVLNNYTFTDLSLTWSIVDIESDKLVISGNRTFKANYGEEIIVTVDTELPTDVLASPDRYVLCTSWWHQDVCIKRVAYQISMDREPLRAQAMVWGGLVFIAVACVVVIHELQQKEEKRRSGSRVSGERVRGRPQRERRSGRRRGKR